jgi:HEAT repeat protein
MNQMISGRQSLKRPNIKMRSDRSKSKNLAFSSMLLLFVLFGASGARSADFNAYLEKFFADIAQYDYGQSRERLTEFSDLVKRTAASPESLKQIQDGMVRLMLSDDATFAAKQFISRELSVIATDEVAAPLAKLLLDAQTADIARYVLERVHGEKVDRVLLQALGSTSGLVQIGIINSLGQRRAKNAVADLGELVVDADPQIASSAAAALGKIGTEEAATALAAAVSKAGPDLRGTILDAYLSCAALLSKEVKTEKAAEIYRDVFNRKDTPTARAAALRGLVRVSGNKGLDIVVGALKEDEPDLSAAALSIVRDLPEDTDITPLLNEFDALPDDGRVQLLAALSDRIEKKAGALAEQAAHSENETLRIEAIKTLGIIGNESHVELLAQAAATRTGKEQETARMSLNRLMGDAVNQRIEALIPQAEPGVKVELIKSVGERGMNETYPLVLSVAQKDGDRRVRVEAVKVLGLVTMSDNLPALIDLLLQAQSDAERRELERSIILVSQNIEDKDNQADAMIAVLPSVTDIKALGSLLQVIGKTGAAPGLVKLREALQNENAEIQVAAIQALSVWPNAEPVSDLESVAQNASDPQQRILALRGYIELNKNDNQSSPATVLERYKLAMQMANDMNEKRMVLSGVGTMNTTGALDMAKTYLKDESLQNEAEVAVVQIARNMGGEHPEASRKALQEIIATTHNESTKRDARRILGWLN